MVRGPVGAGEKTRQHLTCFWISVLIMTVAIVDYGVGNLASVAAAVEKVGYSATITNDPALIKTARKLILPGVGAFGDGMKLLRERGLVEPLNTAVLSLKTPILGICLGFQLIAKKSEEFGEHQGLGWIDAEVVRLTPNDASLRVPHVGWNELYQTKPSPLFDGIEDGTLFYYVHSYQLRPSTDDMVVGECDYGGRFVAAVQQDNIFAVQFHPEKSQLGGLALLNNFLKMEG